MSKPDYIGNFDKPVEQRGTTWTVNEWFGYDEATKRVAVKNLATDVNAAVPAKGSIFTSDDGFSFPKMFKFGHRVFLDGAWAVIESRYIGSRTGTPTDAIIEDNTAVQSATLATDSPNDPPVDVLYRTQTRVARYFAFSQPTAPIHKGVSGNNQQFTPFDHDPPLSLLDGDLNFGFTLTTTRFGVRNLITGQMWEVTEEHAFRIHDRNEEEIPDV